MTSEATTRDPALKPCPFCGNAEPEGGSCGRKYVVLCGTCEASTEGFGKDDAYARWNRRVPPPTSEAPAVQSRTAPQVQQQEAISPVGAAVGHPIGGERFEAWMRDTFPHIEGDTYRACWQAALATQAPSAGQEALDRLYTRLHFAVDERDLRAMENVAKDCLAALRASTPGPGWKLVPVQADGRMLRAGISTLEDQADFRLPDADGADLVIMEAIYVAMTEAAPSHPGQQNIRRDGNG